MVCISIYDTKVVAILSTACTSLTWREKTRKVFDKDAGINMLMKYLRSEVIADYNHGMNSVDQADLDVGSSSLAGKCLCSLQKHSYPYVENK